LHKSKKKIPNHFETFYIILIYIYHNKVPLLFFKIKVKIKTGKIIVQNVHTVCNAMAKLKIIFTKPNFYEEY